ncbi:MAG: hypothetical protein CMA63_08190 [Euryarchaeota archaeon]|nr:hypothetical protein [Euryarchaeota archaeon]
MEIVGSESHEYSGTYPCRVPVWWGRFSEPGPHPQLDGVTGKLVLLRIEKRFNRFERLLAKLFRAPREVRRPLDRLNSMLWELCDGTREFEEVCRHMDATFNEEMAPVVDRTYTGIEALRTRNLMTVLREPYARKWNTGPGIVPKHQTLGQLDGTIDIDSTPSHEGEHPIIEDNPQGHEPDVQSS